ncbi:TPA: ShlB/FhaC/HecB family hemolysin secretion/activation protein [Neisseria meningitidis]|uniref:ShlB/FhaC/HecB family hemolysin secretion/activation protein n=1 Tax=Neisseria meningitidis TaxID=487 RepID=UPI000BB63D21|nr:ShlB/FhaC/HecB family hemolysin secretion/activation protein [Neisseria meningitidis]MBW3880702.1 ShlB/FhaC/HecB family hemolysin secretion/activation protein [Neisseria meningitidis]MCL4978962.1 ShlB/FhaC/HecB family hemolysin secretion/activation protein [Neisseria meningitidis]MCL4998972.1 ShlB/FhaC/HecB family hemolysin secretion/activation protein [Neisseria meningitidis]MCL5764077.1 ShlB/FhaC/HecB family hemolysin secretion/activation protein [Neisseria meningitidis]MCL5824942.1 ShlB/
MKLPLSYLPNIRFLSWCCLLAGIIAPATLLASPNPAESRMQQDIQQRQREEQLRQTMQPESDVRLHQKNTGETVNQLMGDDSSQPCFAINEVVLEGEHHARFQFALKRALRETGFQAGKCLHAGNINQIMSLAQNVLIGRGYTTTRILAAPQDLNSGKLQLTLIPGYLRSIRIDRSNDDQTHAGRIAAFQNKFPTRSNDLLNLRDLEQGLENLKRLPTAEADLQIVPVEGEPNQSDVVVQWRQRLLPYRVSVGMDNSGSEATGKYQGNITFSADNPLGLSDMFYVNYGRSIGGTPDEESFDGHRKEGGSNNYAVHYSAPFGKWTWAFNHNGYRYHQAVSGLSEVYDYNGKSYNTDFGFNRLLYRDAKRKTYLGVKLWMRETKSYIDDAELTVQRRKTAGWLAELSHKEYIGRSTADFKLKYKRGTGMKDALRAPEEAFGEGTSRMKIWTASADVNTPFQIGKQLFAYDTSVHAQWNKTPLTSQDKLAIGGHHTVRGFDGEMSLSAERGWYWRNDLSWQFKPGHQLYLGADVGHVSGQSAKWLSGQTLVGTAIGIRGQIKLGGNLHYDIFTGRALKKPEFFQSRKWASGFQVGYTF